MNQIYTFHHHETSSTKRMAPSAYYVDAEYEKVSARVYAEKAPVREAKIDIFDDGVSIFRERGIAHADKTTGEISTTGIGTEAMLSSGSNSDELAHDFNENIIEQGSWVYCELIDDGGGKNFTVQLELRQLSEDEEQED